MPRASILATISRILGWSYFLCWSLSFYPQPLSNFQRRSTRGLTIDFPTANVLGFLSLTCANAAFLFSPLIRAQYASRHPLSPLPTVQLNDGAYALHGLLLCLITYSQFWSRLWAFKAEPQQKASSAMLGICTGGVLSVGIVTVIILAKGEDWRMNSSSWAWIEVIYALSYLKLCLTIVKYIPQAWKNYRRKSTEGWSIVQILLDFAGSILSLLQLVTDASAQGDWSGITGNPAKFGLGNISLVLDIVFICQHYVLYGPNDGSRLDEDLEESSERRPLLQERDADHAATNRQL